MVRIIGPNERRLHEVSERIVGCATRDDLTLLVCEREVLGVLVEGLFVDHGAHEVREVPHVADLDFAHHLTNVIADRRPQRLRDIHAAGSRTFLALILEGAAHDGDGQRAGIGGGMCDDEILAARLADDAWVAAIVAHVPADRFPHAVEDARTSREMHTRQIAVRQQRVRDRSRITGEEVDDARWQAGFLEDLHHGPPRQNRSRRRFPDHGVAHHCGRTGEVAADGREVERRHRVDEAFQRPVIRLVPGGVRADRLLRVERFGECGVEAPEINQLAGGIDFRLVHGLRLSEHRRGVERGAPGGREQFRRLEKHASSVFPAPRRPLLLRRRRRVDRGRDVLGARLVPVGNHMPMRVRHDLCCGVAGVNALSADHERHLSAFG